MASKEKMLLAFDIGGTKISSALVGLKKKDYTIIDFQKIETPRGKEGVINKIIEIAVNYEKNGGYKEIRMAIAGQVDNEKDVVVHAPNIEGMENVNLKKIIKERIGKNVEVDNDVKCFALAENIFGKGKLYRHIVYLAIGTGIGGAIKIDNKIYRGANNTAGEFGHMIINAGGERCACNNFGCWEQYVSGKAIEGSYRKLMKKNKSAADIAADSSKGVEPDKKIIKEAALCLAAGLVNIVNTINPEIIIIGGSIVKSKEILDIAVKEMRDRALIPAKRTLIETTDMDDEVFLVGAALL